MSELADAGSKSGRDCLGPEDQRGGRGPGAVGCSHVPGPFLSLPPMISVERAKGLRYHKYKKQNFEGVEKIPVYKKYIYHLRPWDATPSPVYVEDMQKRRYWYTHHPSLRKVLGILLGLFLAHFVVAALPLLCNLRMVRLTWEGIEKPAWTYNQVLPPPTASPLPPHCRPVLCAPCREVTSSSLDQKKGTVNSMVSLPLHHLVSDSANPHYVSDPLPRHYGIIVALDSSEP